MWSTVVPWASYFASGFVAGTVNSLAGGGRRDFSYTPGRAGRGNPQDSSV